MKIRTLIAWTGGALLGASILGYCFGWPGVALPIVLGAVGLVWSLLEDSRQAESGGRFASMVMEQRWKAERDVTPGL